MDSRGTASVTIKMSEDNRRILEFYRQVFAPQTEYDSGITHTFYADNDIHLSHRSESCLNRRLIHCGLKDPSVCTTDLSYLEDHLPPRNIQESPILLDVYNTLKEYEYQKKERFCSKTTPDKITERQYFIIALIAKKIEAIVNQSGTSDIDNKIALINQVIQFICLIKKDRALIASNSNSMFHFSLQDTLISVEVMLEKAKIEQESIKESRTFQYYLAQLNLYALINHIEDYALNLFIGDYIPSNICNVLLKDENNYLAINHYKTFKEDSKNRSKDIPIDAKNYYYNKLLQEENIYQFIQTYFLKPKVVANHIRKDCQTDEEIAAINDQVTMDSLKSLHLCSHPNRWFRKSTFPDQALKHLAHMINLKNDLLKMNILYELIKKLTLAIGNLAKLSNYHTIISFINTLKDKIEEIDSTIYLLQNEMRNHKRTHNYPQSQWNSNFLRYNDFTIFNTLFKSVREVIAGIANSITPSAIEKDNKNLELILERIERIADLCKLPTTKADKKRAKRIRCAAQETAEHTQHNKFYIMTNKPNFPDDTQFVHKAHIIGKLKNQIKKLARGLDTYTDAYIDRVERLHWFSKLFVPHGQTGINRARKTKETFKKKLEALQARLNQCSLTNEEELAQFFQKTIEQFILSAKQEVIQLKGGNLNHSSYKTYLMACIAEFEIARDEANRIMVEKKTPFYQAFKYDTPSSTKLSLFRAEKHSQLASKLSRKNQIKTFSPVCSHL